MCGRYTNELEFSQLKLTFSAFDASFRQWEPRYNVCPSYSAGYEQVVVVQDRARVRRELRLARWWFIPGWWKKPLRQLPTAFNARSEDVAERPLFKRAFGESRCLVPATGWREFVGPRSPKQPHHFRPADGGEFTNPSRAFCFAGLHSTWISPEGEAVDSFTILTTPPTEAAARVHDRMPLVLSTDLYDHWLDADADPTAVLEEAKARTWNLPLEIYPSNPIANDSRFEGPEAIEPALQQRELF